MQQVWIFCVLSLAVVLWPNMAKATSLAIDQRTVERGYTILSEDGTALVALAPGAITFPVFLTLTADTSALPEPLLGMRQASQQFTVSVAPASDQDLHKPLTVGLRVPVSPWRRTVAFFDQQTGTWSELPSRTRADGMVLTEISKPAATVVIMEQPGVPDLKSAAFAIMDSKRQTFLAGSLVDRQLPIASLTKLMTALVVLDTRPEWTSEVVYAATDHRPGGRLGLRISDRVTTRDLFFSMLIGSANNATAALVRSTGLSSQQFVTRMNEKAKTLGLTKTHFTDPTGLDRGNQSTSREITVIAQEAFRHFVMLQATTTRLYHFQTRNTKRQHQVHNTNELVQSSLYLTGGKTGFTNEAGHCLILKTKTAGGEFITTVLGAPSSSTRFQEAFDLAQIAPRLIEPST